MIGWAMALELEHPSDSYLRDSTSLSGLRQG
jgi:hypothetical protein